VAPRFVPIPTGYGAGGGEGKVVHWIEGLLLGEGELWLARGPYCLAWPIRGGLPLSMLSALIDVAAWLPVAYFFLGWIWPRILAGPGDSVVERPTTEKRKKLIYN
jgi:hypothetical protein